MRMTQLFKTISRKTRMICKMPSYTMLIGNLTYSMDRFSYVSC